MSSCRIPASRSQAQPFPCWGERRSPQPELARLEREQLQLPELLPATWPASSRSQRLRRPIPHLLVQQRRAARPERAENLPSANEIGRDLRGCGAGERLFVPVSLRRMFRQPSQQAEAAIQAARARALLSRAETRLQEPRPPHAAALPALRHKIWAATAPEPWLFPWHLPASCGALSARSSIYAYSLLVAHRRTTEQSSPRIGRDTGRGFG